LRNVNDYNPDESWRPKRVKRLILIAPAALLLLGANVPSSHATDGEIDSVNAAGAPAAAAAAAPKAAPAPAPVQRTARTNYPRCSATITDRCIQGRGSTTYRSAARPAPRRQYYAMRAGERG
jgi:pimeloyl-ACP methyl ester carboxylesterase